MINRCKNVGVMTFHFALNYGARLQAYALQKYLEMQGYNVTVINYLPRRAQFDIARTCVPLKPTNVLTSYYNLIRLNKFKDKIVSLNTSRIYRNLEELRREPPKLDAYICGSDQIWNPNCSPNKDIQPYLLDFGLSNSKRLAYAVSLGNCPEAVLENTDFWSPLNSFNSISVRESDAVSIIQKLSRRKVDVCVDPTMLFAKSDYHRLFNFEKRRDSDRFFAYFLNPNTSEVTRLFQKFQSSGLYITQIFGGSFVRFKTSERIVPAPSGWVKSISEASGVITNSFHGVVFSIIFNKRFLFLSLVGQEAKKNLRVAHLLNLLNLEERMISGQDLGDPVNLMLKPIDWLAVNKRVEQLSLQSKKFLDDALA